MIETEGLDDDPDFKESKENFVPENHDDSGLIYDSA